MEDWDERGGAGGVGGRMELWPHGNPVQEGVIHRKEHKWETAIYIWGCAFDWGVKKGTKWARFPAGQNKWVCVPCWVIFCVFGPLLGPLTVLPSHMFLTFPGALIFLTFSRRPELFNVALRTVFCTKSDLCAFVFCKCCTNKWLWEMLCECTPREPGLTVYRGPNIFDFPRRPDPQ